MPVSYVYYFDYLNNHSICGDFGYVFLRKQMSVNEG
jgi:hypothetical protein